MLILSQRMQLNDKHTIKMNTLASCHAAHRWAWDVHSYYELLLIIWCYCRRDRSKDTRTHCCVGPQPRDMAFVSWWTGCRRCRTGGSPGQTCGPPLVRAQGSDTYDWTISPAWPDRSDPGAHQSEIKTKLSFSENPWSKGLNAKWCTDAICFSRAVYIWHLVEKYM